MEAWSLCDPYRMDYQLSHATIFIEPNKYIIARLPGVVNTFFSDFSVFTGNLGCGVWMSGALERRRKLFRRSEAALGLPKWALRSVVLQLPQGISRGGLVAAGHSCYNFAVVAGYARSFEETGAGHGASGRGDGACAGSPVLEASLFSAVCGASEA